MRITKDITSALGFKTRKQAEEFISKVKSNGVEMSYSIFGGLTLLLILVGISIFG